MGTRYLMMLWMKTNFIIGRIMGFIRAALSSGLNSFNDSKFKEAIVLPNNLTADALAIKGQLLTKDPDGTSRQSNQNTGLLTDGSSSHCSNKVM